MPKERHTFCCSKTKTVFSSRVGAKSLFWRGRGRLANKWNGLKEKSCWIIENRVTMLWPCSCAPRGLDNGIIVGRLSRAPPSVETTHTRLHFLATWSTWKWHSVFCWMENPTPPYLLWKVLKFAEWITHLLTVTFWGGVGRVGCSPIATHTGYWSDHK